MGECRNEARYKGYLETLVRHGIDFNANYIFETKQTELEGYEVMERLMQSGSCPNGIYCANDITAIGMLKCLKKYGSRRFSPSIIASVSLLLNRIRGEHTSVLRMEFEGKLIIRSSCEMV